MVTSLLDWAYMGNPRICVCLFLLIFEIWAVGHCTAGLSLHGKPRTLRVWTEVLFLSAARLVIVKRSFTCLELTRQMAGHSWVARIYYCLRTAGHKASTSALLYKPLTLDFVYFKIRIWILCYKRSCFQLSDFDFGSSGDIRYCSSVATYSPRTLDGWLVAGQHRKVHHFSQSYLVSCTSSFKITPNRF